MKVYLATSVLLAALASASPAPAVDPSAVVCNKLCPVGQICVVVPGTRRTVCVVPEFCGGIAAFQCENKTDICIDDPRDDCDPKHGGADCGGICIPGSA